MENQENAPEATQTTDTPVATPTTTALPVESIWNVNGRISIAEYWKWYLILWAFYFVSMILSTFLIGIPLFFVTLYLDIMIRAKRLHDFGMTAWLVVPTFLMPPLGVIIIGCFPPSKGANEFGKTPSKLKLF